MDPEEEQHIQAASFSMEWKCKCQEIAGKAADSKPGDSSQSGLDLQPRLVCSLVSSSFTMDAIRKKMQSLKSETDGLYKTIAGFEEATREAAARADQVDLPFNTISTHGEQCSL